MVLFFTRRNRSTASQTPFLLRFHEQVPLLVVQDRMPQPPKFYEYNYSHNKFTFLKRHAGGGPEIMDQFDMALIVTPTATHNGL